MLNPVGEVVYRLQSWALLDTNGPAIFFFPARANVPASTKY